MHNREREASGGIGDNDSGVHIVHRSEEPAKPSRVKVRRWSGEGPVRGVEAGVR